MNREIKFRAWVSKENRYKIPVGMIGEESIKTMIDPKFTKIPAEWCWKECGIILMQFTGFKDCNGKEIYDGDILSDEVKTDEGVINSSFQVFWNEISGNWSLDYSFKQDKTSCCALHADLNKYKYKVIGNIFENKDKLASDIS